MKKLKTHLPVLLFLALAFAALQGCEKDKHIPPDVQLKTGAGYTSANATVAKNSSVTVGIIATKVEDDMISYNVSYAYDGAATTTTSQTFQLSGAERQNYNKDVTFTTRNVAGTERWIFTITDKDGNIAQKQIVITVP